MAALLVLTSCKGAPGSGEDVRGPVEIPVIFQVDPASDHRTNEELVEAFNREYEGRYRVQVQWMFDTTSAYRSQIKQLNATDELPAVLTDVAFSPSFFQLLVGEERLLNLAPALEADGQWKSLVDEDALSPCYGEDGSLYLMPISSNCFSCSGIFYNKELFLKAGIKEFPESWEDFWQCCERLKASGITPLALHTEGTAWASMLLATAYVGGTEAGGRFLNCLLPESYDDFGPQMGAILKKAFSYTTADAVGSDFDIAFGHFVREEAAMLPNGHWMIAQLDEELAGRVGFAPLPGNVLVVSPQMSGWSVVSGYPKEVQEGAMEFLRFRSETTRQQADELLEGDNPSGSLEGEYKQALKSGAKAVSNYQIQWNPILQEKVLPDAIGRLAGGEIDEQGFTELLNDSVRQFQREQ